MFVENQDTCDTCGIIMGQRGYCGRCRDSLVDRNNRLEREISDLQNELADVYDELRQIKNNRE